MEKVKKQPTRRCTGCGEHFPKSTLVRVVRDPEGNISLDLTGKRAGRGAYICRKSACLKKAEKTRRIETSLECPIPKEVYQLLLEELDGAKD